MAARFCFWNICKITALSESTGVFSPQQQLSYFWIVNVLLRGLWFEQRKQRVSWLVQAVVHLCQNRVVNKSDARGLLKAHGVLSQFCTLLMKFSAVYKSHEEKF